MKCGVIPLKKLGEDLKNLVYEKIKLKTAEFISGHLLDLIPQVAGVLGIKTDETGKTDYSEMNTDDLIKTATDPAEKQSALSRFARLLEGKKQENRRT